MRTVTATLLSLLLFVPFGIAQSTKQDFLKERKYVEKPVKPAFRTLTGEDVRAAIKVVPVRSSALMQFNQPGVAVYLPPGDNGVYATWKFGDAKLVDRRGNAVRFELEQGLYSYERGENQIRFGGAEGKPVEFAKASGTVQVRYPLAIKTLSARAKDAKSLAAAGVKLDGPFVTYTTSGRNVAEEDGFPPFLPVRAWDAAGKQIEHASYSGFSSADGVETLTKAFYGEVASVELDIVEKWAIIDIAYEVPSAPKLPDSQAGLSHQAEAVEAPGSRITKTLLGDAAARAALVPDSVKQSLAELDYRDISEDNFVGAAIKGDIDACRLFLQAGLPIDSRSQGFTPLLGAAMYGKIDVVVMLASQGADVNATDENGVTPLIRIADNCDATEAIKALVAKGANVNAKAKGGGTPLMLAQVSNCTENVRILKAKGAK